MESMYTHFEFHVCFYSCRYLFVHFKMVFNVKKVLLHICSVCRILKNYKTCLEAGVHPQRMSKISHKKYKHQLKSNFSTNNSQRFRVEVRVFVAIICEAQRSKCIWGLTFIIHCLQGPLLCEQI